MKVIIDITLIEGNKDYIEIMDHTIDLETEWEIERYVELKDSMKAFIEAMLKKQKNGIENKERIEEITITDNMKNKTKGFKRIWEELSQEEEKIGMEIKEESNYQKGFDTLTRELFNMEKNTIRNCYGIGKI
ncbi:hypothetical protein C1645_834993 [Glomus cerebriforme]|uniref:Uncharacterized protein n=1 Tax=Glomus cerebriforme TaxID=658196 RepID=A0A397S9M4_9GLOM|nr:hypothetical protein C1645_834993 [Glomus cerebriforme]